MRARLFTLSQVVFASVLMAVLMRLSTAHGTTADALTLGAAFLILGMFDVWLPRGDPADMTGTIAFASGVLLPPIVALAVVGLSRLLLDLFRPGRGGFFRVLDDLSRQVAVMALAASCYWLAIRTPVLFDQNVGQYVVVAIAAAVFFIGDFLLAQLRSSARLGSTLTGLLIGNIKLQGWMHLAQVSASVLCVLLFSTMGLWGLIVVASLLLVMRQAFALLIDVRVAYRSTVEVLARAMEAQNPGGRGHCERVACSATAVGRLLGFHGAQLENLRYAALFHDVAPSGPRTSADVLSTVTFLSGSVPILRVLETAGIVAGSQSEVVLVSAYVVARMSALDGALHMSSPAVEANANAIGLRLYEETRREVDRAIERVANRVRAGELIPEPIAELAV